MKTFQKTVALLLVSISVAFTSCSKSEEPSVPAPTPGNVQQSGDYINCKIDGVVYNSVGVTRGGPLSIKVFSSASQTTNVSIEMKDVTSTGTYTLGNSATSKFGMATATIAEGVAYKTGRCSTAYGTLVVTSFSATKIVGTFNFVGAKDDCAGAVRTVTEGSFSVSY